ncbi:Vacuolar protein sorting-associated protein 41 [Vermiconidia calcicola]|uniref:Vacuolar protein sorting-associated protein 41 n=1 Tax=Vermiconidia calcicola TaxID=1690605 RepID=A0ACC3NMI7_9PEZI|nr:Vacuolar protein sorting-associated protein 41 [Vermiconidia calcicola]
MSADLQATEQNELHHAQSAADDAEAARRKSVTDDEGTEEEDDEEDDDDEPKLKYTKLTGSLTNVYRNGDSTSAFTVAGDKMVLGTHNGNIHVLSLPTLQSLRTYHAHSATITSVSISPTPPPPRSTAPNANGSNAPSVSSPPPSISRTPTGLSTSRTPQKQSSIPNTLNNALYIATSSLDGHVCISSLLDARDVQLRNFARPVQTVCLSPDYKTDRTFLSGGLAGHLILTVGGKAGVTVDANTNSAAAAASGWLSSVGLGGGGGGDRGRDTVLHSGEGVIREVKWSLSGKWVVWVNEEGIKIMRSHLKLGSEEGEDAWRRIAHAARPNRKEWEDMAGVWKGRAEWVDEGKLEVDDEGVAGPGNGVVVNGTGTASSRRKGAKVEKLVMGWGDTAWILLVREGGTAAGTGRRQVGSADIVHKVRFEDCIVSGITLYTPSLLAILAYRTRDDDDNPIHQPNTNNETPPSKKTQRHRHTGLAPQLRLINVTTNPTEQVDLDELSISRFETLSAQDYHLSTLYIPPLPPSKISNPSTNTNEQQQQRGALEGLWDAAGGKYASRMFSSSASVLSRSSDDKTGSYASPTSSAVGVPAPAAKQKRVDAAHPYATESGLKLFIQSPYDCVLAVKRDLKDHMEWLLERREYEQAWELVDAHPEIIESDAGGSDPGSPSRGGGGGEQQGTLADFFADSSRHSTGLLQDQQQNAAAEREKRRIGDLWLQQLTSASRWSEAGRVAGKVLGSSTRWEHWVWTFAHADRFDDIAPHIPSGTEARLPPTVYEVVLGHYVHADVARLKELLEVWDPGLELFDAGSVVAAIETRFRGSEDEGMDKMVAGGKEEWKVLTECLARLYLADGRASEALRCWIRAQNAEQAFRLIKEEKLMDVVAAEDVTGLLMLRVSQQMMAKASLRELEEATEEAVQLLVEEAHRGTVMPATVLRQLERQGSRFKPFMFFYLRSLWRGDAATEQDESNKPRLRSKFSRRTDEGHALVEDHADLAVELFAQYDRDLLLTFLRASSVYSYEAAATTCEQLHYIPELVYVLSKTGQTKRALFLIIGELGDVSQAIAFAKENAAVEDLLDYGMDKPAFIRGLLEEGGLAVDPLKLVRRIPEGLEIEGLKGGVENMMHEYEIQVSISEGVARVLRGEVAHGMETLRAGQRKGVRFEVVREDVGEVELSVQDPPTKVDGGEELPVPRRKVEIKTVQPGHCVGCSEVFSEDDKEPLIGFACGHVYHLSCLLKANPETADADTIERLLSQLGNGNSDDGYTGRSVGAKVAHAHVIKNVVKGGCRHCLIPEGA